MTQVIKKGGKKQALSPAKLKKGVEKAAKEVKMKKAAIEKLVKETAMPLLTSLKKKRSIRASAIRKAILGRIARKSKKVAKAWQKFDRKKKK